MKYTGSGTTIPKKSLQITQPPCEPRQKKHRTCCVSIMAGQPTRPEVVGLIFQGLFTHP